MQLSSGVATPIHGHGREVLRWWPPVFCDFESLFYTSPQSDWPLFLQKKSVLSLSHLAPEILHSEKSLARSMLFYSRNCRQQNWAQFVLYVNSDCMYIGDLWLQLWLKNHCKNTGYYSIFQLLHLMLLNNVNYEYNCNNTILLWV